LNLLQNIFVTLQLAFPIQIVQKIFIVIVKIVYSIMEDVKQKKKIKKHYKPIEEDNRRGQKENKII